MENLDENGNPIVVPVATQAPAENQITLSDGRIAVVRDAIGRDQINAVKLIEGNKDMFYYALFELCVLIDGQKVFMSDYDAMKLKDITALTILFDKVNF